MSFRNTILAGLAAMAALTCSSDVHAGSVRFFGNGTGDIDRIKIPIDDPDSPNDPNEPPADVGATDFTIEFWIRGTKADNNLGVPTCAPNVYGWRSGHVIFDRDRFGQDRSFGISVSRQGLIAFGANVGGDLETICGFDDVLDDTWHHVAVTRSSAGEMRIFVDGIQNAITLAGPVGDLSYPDDAVPDPTGCNGSCRKSDPFIVLGAEKHDQDSVNFPSFEGLLDELRISSGVRYASGGFMPATEPFDVDPATLALYHFDDTTGTQAVDVLGTSPGEMSVGGTPAGPVFGPDTPFSTTGPGTLQLSQASYFVSEPSGTLSAKVMRVGGTDGDASVRCMSADGSAVAPGDYTAVNVVLTWADNDGAEKACVVPIVADNVGETDETFTLLLSNESGARRGTPSTATVNLTDSAPGGLLRFTQSGFTVNEAVGTFNVSVTRQDGSVGGVSVVISTQDGSATAGSDYAASSAILTWTAGETGTKNATITVTNDTAAESSETFTVVLSDATGGASIGAPSSATVTITDNDSSGGGGGGGGAIGWMWLLAGLQMFLANRRRQ